MIHSERQQLMSVIYVLAELDLCSHLLADKLELLKLEIDQDFLLSPNFKEYISSLVRPLGKCIENGSELVSKNALSILDLLLFCPVGEAAWIADRLLPNVIDRYATAVVSRSTNAYDFLCSLIRKRHHPKLLEFLCNSISMQNNDSRATTYELITMIVGLHLLNLIGDVKEIPEVLHFGINSSSKQLRTSALSGAQALVKKIPNLASRFPMLEFRPAHSSSFALPSQGAEKRNDESSNPRTISPTSQPSLRPRRTLFRAASIYHKCDNICCRRGLCTLVDFGIRYGQELVLFPPEIVSNDIFHIPLTPANPKTVSSGPSMPSASAIVGNLPSSKPAQARSPKRSFESLKTINSNLSRVNHPSPKLQKREAAPLNSKRFTVSGQASEFSQSVPLNITRHTLCQQKPPVSFAPKRNTSTSAFPQHLARQRKLSLPSTSHGNDLGPSSTGPRAPRRSLPSQLSFVGKAQS